MLSQPKNRVQAIKSKFENLNVEPTKQPSLLFKIKNESDRNKENTSRAITQSIRGSIESESSDDSAPNTPEPNFSYLHKSDAKRTLSEPKPLTRQISDPGKKLHRSHAFRCDRTQKITSPKRAGSVNSRPEAKMDRKLSRERLKRLGDALDVQMRKENFQLNAQVVGEIKQVGYSVPDVDVPPHILAQYAQVIKPKRRDDKSEVMTDSGVSSETENLEEEKGRVKKISSQFESSQLERKEVLEKKFPLLERITQFESQNILDSTNMRLDGNTKFPSANALEINPGLESKEKTETIEINTNLDIMENLACSSETMKLERKNPHLKLTDTLKKALKQPLPPGPPPKKPPRMFNIPTILENEKNDTKRKLEKLEKVLMKREASKKDENIYDIAEDNLSLKRPKEIHYLCTEILDITQRTLLHNHNESPLKNCFKLNCAAKTNSMSSLPYSRLSAGFDSNRNSFKNCCSCSTDSLNITDSSIPLLNSKCVKCQDNHNKHGFKCHLNCKCRVQNSEFYVDEPGSWQPVVEAPVFDAPDEPIYDEPFVSDDVTVSERRNVYGTLNSVGVFSKSMEDLRGKERKEDAIYEIVADFRPSTPDPTSPKLNKAEFQKLLQNFENGTAKLPKKATRKSLEHLNWKFQLPDAFAERAPKTETRSHAKYDLGVRDGRASPKFEVGKVSPKLEVGKLSPKFEVGKLSPKLEVGKLSPKFEVGKLSPKDGRSPSEFEEGKAVVKFSKKDKKFSTEVRRYKPERNLGYSLQRKNPQLDVDRENLNALMNEIYETVTAACNMENRPGCFPTDQAESSSSEESVKRTRSLTEKRKNYVRRVSSRVAYLEPKATRFRHQTSICSYKSEVLSADRTDSKEFDNQYSTFRSWKSFRASQNNLKMDSDSKFNLTDSTGNILTLKNEFDSTPSIDIDTESIDERAGCVHIDVPYSRERGLFSVCLLVGIDGNQEQATRKLVFPSQVQVPQHIESLIFPETLTQEKETWSADAPSTQCYSFVLTDERGERSYGYCRRVLPEGAAECLPLCYCLISKFRAPGFYYKVLQIIESHHGVSQATMSSILQQLLDADLPSAGESLSLTIDDDDVDRSDVERCNVECNSESDNNNDKPSAKCNSAKSDKCKTLDSRVSEKFYDPENNNSLRELMLSLNGVRLKTLTRPLEPRAEESSSCDLLDTLGAGLLVKVFGSLLLERKLIVRADKLSVLSSLLEGLQSLLYPFVWQQPLISCVPREIQRAVLDAPLPILAGVLDRCADAEELEEGMFIDLGAPSLVRCYQGDESSILPTDSYKTLKTALNLDSVRNKDRDDTKTRNVMISEAFLRFFVDILGDYWRFFSVGTLGDGDLGRGDVVFDKEAFIKHATSKQNQYFLEWFTETAMFNHFIQNMAVRYKQTEPDSYKQSDSSKTNSLIDTPTPNYYQLFEERVNSRRTRANVDRSGYKNALNKRVKLLKARLKDLIG